MTTETERRIADRYVLEEPLGKGGMGVVWRARDTVLQREVAIKRVEVPVSMAAPEVSAVRRRVLREARAAAALNHANAVTVFDVLEEDDHAYIVMELVRAPTLKEVVDSRGPMSPPEVADVGLGVLAALNAAHVRGITHRDVKPGNVMLSENGAVKLADFGIASVKDDPKITATGMVLGSPQFMAPEQARQGEAGPPADLWGLGATLYFAVEARPPFEKDGGPIQVLTAVLHENHRPLERGGALSHVIEALLSKDPDTRPDEDEARRMLEDVSSRGGEPAPAGAARGAAIAAGGTTVPVEEGQDRTPEAAVADRPEPPTTVPEPSSQRPRRGVVGWLVAVGILALLAVVGALTLSDLLSGEDPRREGRRSQGSQTQGRGGNGDGEGEGSPSADFQTYTEPSTGWSIDYPSSWEIDPVDSTMIDISAPEPGTYMRVDWTDDPGPSALEAWEDSSDTFGSSHAGYTEIRIDPTTFMDSDNAAEWEYTYSEGGLALHAVNLGFVTPDEDYGFALNYQTTEDRWEESQETFEAMKDSFELP